MERPFRVNPDTVGAVESMVKAEPDVSLLEFPALSSAVTLIKQLLLSIESTGFQV